MHFECSICMDDHAAEVACLPCGHIFHESCVFDWLRRKLSCPTCRNSVGVYGVRRVYLSSTESTVHDASRGAQSSSAPQTSCLPPRHNAANGHGGAPQAYHQQPTQQLQQPTQQLHQPIQQLQQPTPQLQESIHRLRQPIPPLPMPSQPWQSVMHAIARWDPDRQLLGRLPPAEQWDPNVQQLSRVHAAERWNPDQRPILRWQQPAQAEYHQMAPQGGQLHQMGNGSQQPVPPPMPLPRQYGVPDSLVDIMNARIGYYGPPIRADAGNVQMGEIQQGVENVQIAASEPSQGGQPQNWSQHQQYPY